MNKEISGELLGTCDIDFTLLDWGRKFGRMVTFKHPFTEEELKVAVNEANLQILTNWLARGATILVWSRSGVRWADAALKALNLTHPNIYVASKPMFYIDDNEVSKWMGEQVFLHFTDKWGTGIKEE